MLKKGLEKIIHPGIQASDPEADFHTQQVQRSVEDFELMANSRETSAKTRTDIQNLKKQINQTSLNEFQYFPSQRFT